MIGFGPFDLDTEMREIRRDGGVLPIGSRAFDILCVLATAAGRVVTKDELMKAVWPATIVEENNIQVHLSALRRELGRNWIVTVPGRGYQLVQPRRDVSSQSSTLANDKTFVASASPLPLRGAIVGRDEAVEELRTMLAPNRVVTLVGAGGIGKTALALAAVQRVAEGQVENYVCFVGLGALRGAIRFSVLLRSAPATRVQKKRCLSSRWRRSSRVVSDSCCSITQNMSRATSRRSSKD